MECNKTEYQFYGDAISKVSKLIIKTFNQAGKLFYDNLVFKENISKIIYNAYLTFGFVVDKDAIYLGYDITLSKRILFVYIDKKIIEQCLRYLVKNKTALLFVMNNSDVNDIKVVIKK